MEKSAVPVQSATHDTNDFYRTLGVRHCIIQHDVSNDNSDVRSTKIDRVL